MLPELIRMQCSMMGHGKVLLLVIFFTAHARFWWRSIWQPDDVDSQPPRSGTKSCVCHGRFSSFVGAVTGFSQNIGLAKKLMTQQPKETKGIWRWKADSFVIRDVIEFAKTRKMASQLKAAYRTWPIWIGLGDYTSQQFNAMEYTREVVNVYNDQTLPGATNQTMFDDVAYIDKHPQPSPHLDMPDLVKQYYGTMTATNIIQNFPRIMESGDVHIALYDFGAKQAYIAVGTTNSTGAFVRKAYESPFIQFDMNTLWSEK